MMRENERLFLEEIDAAAILDEYLSTNSRQVKRELIQEGFTHQVSFYGTIRNLETHVSENRRIEVFSDRPYREGEVKKIRTTLEEIKPRSSYTIYRFISEKKSLKAVARYGPRTY